MSRKEFAGAAGKVLLASFLAIISANLIAKRVFDCPTVYHPLLGRVPKPGASFRWQIEGNGDGLWTSNCVRRASLPEASAKGNLLILGDSFTEALHVTDDEHYAHILEKRLATNGFDTAVLAVGRPGYSVADYVAKAGIFRKLFSPAWVIIQVGDDDFCNDAWTLGKPNGFAHFKYVDASHNSIELVATAPSPNPGICDRVNDHLPYLFPITLFAQDRIRVVKPWLRDRNQPWFHAEAGGEAKEEKEGPSLEDYPAGQEMQMLAQAYEKRLTLLYLPPFAPLHPERETANEAALRRLAEASGIHFVSLRERFQWLAAAGHVPYGFNNTQFNQGHWNRYGHEAGADILFEECQRIRYAFH